MSSVSVVMPTFNRVDLMRHVLPSYLGSPTVGEVIVVDDGSRDGTGDCLASLAEQDQRIRAVRNDTNIGLPASRNRGAALATGQWILTTEDDLELDVDTLPVLLEHAESSAADIIAPRRVWMRIGESRADALARANRHTGPVVDLRALEHDSHACTEHDVAVPLLGATMLMRREVIDRVAYHAAFAGHSSWREDSDFQLQAFAQGFRLVFCPHTVTYHHARNAPTYTQSRVRGDLQYLYRIFENNRLFLERHRSLVQSSFPQALLFGSPLLSSVRYTVRRAVWLARTEALRWYLARRSSAFRWREGDA